MLKANPSSGFTILEVTIAITLTMAGLVLAMVTINSRLRQENFQRGASIFGTVLDDILNDVSTNNWPHVSDWACDLNENPDPARPTDLSLNPKDLNFWMEPGHETGDGNCLYVGKVIQFGDEKQYNEEDNTYIVHTIMTHRDALVPTYNFDRIAQVTDPSKRIHPLGVVEKLGSPGFSTRETKSWPHGMHVSQVYYDASEDGDLSTTPGDKVFLYGIAVVQQAGHGLKENDLLLTVSGGGQVGIRAVHNEDTLATTGARNPAGSRLTPNDFASSLVRTPVMNRPQESAIEHNFKTPIYICLSDGKGNEVLGILGGGSSSLLIENEFDETKIQDHC